MNKDEEVIKEALLEKIQHLAASDLAHSEKMMGIERCLHALSHTPPPTPTLKTYVKPVQQVMNLFDKPCMEFIPSGDLAKDIMDVICRSGLSPSGYTTCTIANILHKGYPDRTYETLRNAIREYLRWQRCNKNVSLSWSYTVRNKKKEYTYSKNAT